MKKTTKKSLQVRLQELEKRLKKYGLDDNKTTHDLPDEAPKTVHPQQAAERLLILLAVAVTAYNFEEGEKVMDWLKREQLWKAVSDKEKEFFRNPDPADDEKQNLSWRFEAAYMLAWTLEMVPSPPDPASECTEQQINEFSKHVPSVGGSLDDFLAGLDFRPLADIIDENYFYENAVSYFHRLVVEHQENTSQAHSKACHERHYALNWLLHAGEKTDWDVITKTS